VIGRSTLRPSVVAFAEIYNLNLYFTQVTRLLTQKELSPPAGRQMLFLFTPMLHCVQHGCEQDP